MSVVLEPGIGDGVSSQGTASPTGLIPMMKNARFDKIGISSMLYVLTNKKAKLLNI